MHQIKRAAFIVYSMLLMATLCTGIAAAASVTGEVNDDFQIISDSGEAYNIYANDLGNEVVEQVGVRMTVTGDIETVEGEKWINVTSYKVLEGNRDATDKDKEETKDKDKDKE